MSKIYIYISQSFIVVGYLVFFLSRFRNNKKSILITDNISRICSIIGYSFFGSINSIEHTVYGIIRNIVGQALTNKNKIYKVFGFVVMLTVLCIMYCLSFNGVSTVMFILSGIINLFAVVFAKAQGLRIGTVAASICNIIAFLMVGSYASIVGEALCGFVGFLSFIKENRKRWEPQVNTKERCLN